MSALLLLSVCLLLGVLMRRYGDPPAALAPSLNWWVVQIALPAMVLELIPRLHLDPNLWYLVISQWLVFLGAFLLCRFLGRRLGWSNARIGALTLVCGLGNTSFMGYPLLEALRGPEQLALGVVADQLGCSVMLSLGGVMVGVIYAGQAATPAAVAKRVLLFPAFVCLIIGLLVGQLGGWPSQVESVLHRIAQSLAPLALFSVGLRLKLQLARHQWLPVGVALGWKMALAPVVMWSLGSALGVSGAILSVAVLQAAMAPMISAAILAEQFQLEPDLANAVLGIGILLSLVTVPLWSMVLP